jgi:hypothetical protein
VCVLLHFNLQGSMLLLLGPWVDAWVSGRWVGSYVMTMPALGVLLLSCVFSVGVNVSQFMCLGRFSAATFQVRARLLGPLLCVLLGRCSACCWAAALRGVGPLLCVLLDRICSSCPCI